MSVKQQKAVKKSLGYKTRALGNFLQKCRTQYKGWKKKGISQKVQQRDKEIEENTEKANQRASPKKPIPNNRDSRKRRKEINSLVQKDVCQN